MDRRRGQVEVVARPVRFITQVQRAHHHHGNLTTINRTVGRNQRNLTSVLKGEKNIFANQLQLQKLL
jgi:hypothetical protein